MYSRRSVGMVVLGAYQHGVLALTLTQARTTAVSPDMESLYGSWNIEVTAPDLAFPALITFGADGSVISDRPPVRGETSGHGNWSSSDDGTVAYTFVSLFSGDDGGTYVGRTVTLGTLEYDADTDRWQGPFRFDGFDAEGGAGFSVSGTFVLTPIVVQSLD